MKISFDGLRKKITEDFNDLRNETVGVGFTYTAERTRVLTKLGSLRSSLEALNACYDQEKIPEDFNDLSDTVKLKEI